MLSNAGLQVPVIPSKEVVGNGVNGSPLQIGATGLNVGVPLGLTSITSV